MDSDNERIHFQAPNADVLSQMLLSYNVESLIAQGGMGAVYLAEQTALERKVAIKILPDEFGEDAGFRKAFQAEARSMARINHPNLIAVFDFGDIDGMLYIIMEYAEGSSLFHLAEQEDLDHLFVAKVVSQIANGLSAAHDAGILHRDIKPSNILLNGKREAKISDFGLARPHGNTESGIIYGMPGYTAPEVIKNPNAVDIRADIFSVGVILYELLAKTLPTKAYMPVSSLCGAKSDFDNIIRKAIHPSPKMRYSTAKALSEDLDDLARSIEQEQEPKTKTKFNTGAQALKATASNKLLNTGAQALKATASNKLLNTGAQALKATASNKLLNTGAQALKATASSTLKAPSPQLSRPAKAPAPSHLKPSIATGAQLITAAKHDTASTPTLQKPGTSNSPNQLLNAPGSSAEEDASTPVHVATPPSGFAIKPKNPNKALALNLVIIVVLSVACLVAWQFVKEKNKLAEQSRLDRRIADAIPNSEEPPTTTSQTTKIENNGGGTSRPKPRNSIDVALGDGVNDTTNRETISLAEKERTSHEKALKQLHSEKLNLLNGIINPIKLPNNTITRGEHFYLYINQPMSWHQADAFCNEFGGQLANCPTPADAEFLRKAAKEDAPFWLGAGSDPGRNMSTVDGRQFNLNIDRINLGKAVFYQTFTRAAMKHPIEKMTFFMQWNIKGDIPSTVNARLCRLFPSLGQLNPKFPPLTIGSGSRNYCIIYRPLTFEKARELARFAGGHLAVISNEAEQQMIAEHLKNSLPENTKLWVGLIKHKNGNWINDSVETDVMALWEDDQGKDEKFAALTYNQGSLQHVGAGVDKRGKLNATLIEWSQDEYEAYRSLFILDKMNDINSLRDRVRYIIFLEKAYHNYRLQLCPKRLAWAIRTWKNGSERDYRQQFDQSLTGIIKQLEQGASITSSFKASSLPSELEKMVEACLEVQGDLEKSHLKQNKAVRDGYLYALKRLLKEEPLKDSPRAKELQAEIFKHQSSRSTFINMMKN